MEIDRDPQIRAIKLVQEFRKKADDCGGQWLFEETAICLALFHAESIAALTAKKEDYRVVTALRQLQVEQIKTNKNE